MTRRNATLTALALTAALTIVLLSKVRTSGRAFCRFGFTLGRVACTTTTSRVSKSWAVRIYEDGSYTITRKAVR